MLCALWHALNTKQNPTQYMKVIFTHFLIGFSASLTLDFYTTLRHFVQRFMRTVRPSTCLFAEWRFGSCLFFVLLLAWETLFPVSGLFPQISQILLILSSLLLRVFPLIPSSLYSHRLQLPDVVLHNLWLQASYCLLYLGHRILSQSFQNHLH